MARALTVVALAVAGFFIGMAESKDLYKVNRVDLLPWTESIHRLSQGSVGADVVARTLARTANKSGLVSGEFSFNELLSLMTWEYSDCTKAEMQRREGICSKLSGSLLQYCERCVKRIKEICSGSVQSIMENHLEISPVHSLKVVLDSYLKRNDLDGYPLDMAVEDFLGSKIKTTRQFYKSECGKLMRVWDEEVPYFQPNRELASKELREQDYFLVGAVRLCGLILKAVDWRD